MIKKTYTFKKQGSVTLGDLRDFLNETEAIPASVTVSVTRSLGNQFERSETTLSVTEP